MKIARFLILSAVSCVLSIPSFAQGFLHRSGTQIVDGSGNEVILRGMGLGGWLVPEGYMLQTASFANSPSEFRTKITELVGSTEADSFFKLYRANFITRRDIDSLARWGFNSIRLPLHYEFFTPRNQPYVYIPDGFQIVDSVLSWCEANKMYLILDLHCAPGGQNSINISDYTGYPSLWESMENQGRTIELWLKIAERYASCEWIGGYDLINETAWNLPNSNKALRDLMVSITSAIRQVDRNHIVFVEGNWYATDFNGLTPAWDANMAYSFHKYWNTNSPSSISNYLSMRTTSGVPLWLGESGENSNHWFSEAIALMETNRIGWAWWTYKKVETTSAAFSVVKPAGYDALLRYWSGQASKPTQAYAVEALKAFAENLKTANCVYRPDFVDAVIRASRSNTVKPYVNVSLPGIVYAVNYDMGRNGVAYNDLDFQNTGDGAAGNSGYMYRNDGVDIEKCTDGVTNGYDVGWIKAGEFLNFTINVPRGGTFAVDVRAASNAGGGVMRLSVDGALKISSLAITATGSWQTWKTFRAGELKLTAGMHTITAEFASAGFNLNYLQFTQTATDPVPASSQSVQVRQNYPNPVTSGTATTNIQYSIPEDGQVTLKIYNVLGQLVSSQDLGRKTAGDYTYELKTDRFGMASGVYCYQIICNGKVSNTRKAVVLR